MHAQQIGLIRPFDEGLPIFLDCIFVADFNQAKVFMGIVGQNVEFAMGMVNLLRKAIVATDYLQGFTAEICRHDITFLQFTLCRYNHQKFFAAGFAKIDKKAIVLFVINRLIVTLIAAEAVYLQIFRLPAIGLQQCVHKLGAVGTKL